MSLNWYHVSGNHGCHVSGNQTKPVFLPHCTWDKFIYIHFSEAKWLEWESTNGKGDHRDNETEFSVGCIMHDLTESS